MSNWVHVDCICRTFSAGSSKYDKKEIEIYNEYGRKRLLKKIYKSCNKVKEELNLKFEIIPRFKDEFKFNNKIWNHEDDIIVVIYGDKEDCNFNKKYNKCIENLWYNSNIYFFNGICEINTSFDRNILTYDSMKIKDGGNIYNDTDNNNNN